MALAVIGAGKWGSALFHSFKIKNDKVKISSRTKREIENFVSLEEAIETSDYLVIAIATQTIKEFLKRVNLKGKKVLVASKGIDRQNFKFINEIYEEYLDKENLAYVGGPSFAKEVIERKPTALVIASYNTSLAKEFSNFFPNFMKIYISNDVMGVEIAGAYKNVIAIASGICEGLNLGNNAKASLLARGLIEMDRFSSVFGGKRETILGLAGSGDLFLTANSVLSRNYRVGLGLAKGKKLKVILDEIGEVAEGVWTSEAIYKLSRKFGIYTPIASEVYKILHGKKIEHSLRDLLK